MAKSTTDRHQSGFSLIEVVLASAMLAGTVLMIGWNTADMAQKKASADFVIALDENRLRFQNLVGSDVAWAMTVANNLTNMACLQAGSAGCLATAALPPQSFKIYDQNSNLFYNSTSLTAGFTKNGAGCDGTPDCILRLNLTWQPLCDTTSGLDPNCLAPTLQVKGTYVYTGSAPEILNWGAYNFSYLRVVATASAIVPCPTPPVGACPGAKQWICLSPPTYWECHYLIP